MMKQKRPLLPQILEDYDQQLLKNNPETWSARTHLVAYYGLLFMAALAGICFIRPDDPRSESTVGYWVAFVSVVCIIAIVLWMIYLLRFNVFKRYGNITAAGRLKTFFLYFISILTIVLFPYVPPVIESVLAGAAYTSDELVNDANKTNSIVCQLAYDSLPHDWINDTFMVVNTVYDKEYNRIEPEYWIDAKSKSYKVLDTSEYRSQRLASDSVRQLTDSIIVLSKCPSYEFVSNAGAASHSNIKALSSIDLFDLYIRNYRKPDAAKLSAELAVIAKKYDDSADTYYASYADEVYSYFEWIEKTFKTAIISESISNITDRKYRWDLNDFPAYFRILLYTTFIITLLVFIFRHSTVKTFFLTVLAGVLLLILSSLIIAFSQGNESGMLGMMIFYLLLFTFISLTVFSNKNRNPVTGIAINMFTAFIAFAPLIITTLYFKSNEMLGWMDDPRFIAYEEMVHRSIFYAEILGLVLFAILLPTLIHRLYRRWYALPEE